MVVCVEVCIVGVDIDMLSALVKAAPFTKNKKKVYKHT